MHLREVLDDDEERREHREVEAEAGGVRGSEARPAKERERQHRRSGAALLEDEGDQEHGACGVGEERRAGGPALGVAPRRRPHDAEQAAAGEREAGQVERHLRAAALAQAPRGEHGCGQPDRAR